jgi:apolipoprotein N-acyltransferase
VAFVALTPLLVALVGTTPLEGARLGYLTGAVAAIGTLYWTALVVVQYGGLSLPVGIAVMGLLCLAFALFPLVFGLVVSSWLRVFGPTALLLSPLVWVSTELLRGHTFFEFPWCLLGYSQHQNPAAMQIAAYTAVYGVSAAVALASALLAYAVVVPVHRLQAVAALAAAMAALHGYGAWALASPVPETGRARVGLVQAGIVQEDKWRPERATENVDRHIDLTRRAAAEGARLVVWPESAVPFYFDHAPTMAERLRLVARDENIHLLFGNDDRERGEGAGADRVFVGAKMLSPRGELELRYHKMQLVPFGEYVPLQPVLTLGGRVTAKLVEQVADFTPGRVASVGEALGHRLGAFICYESVFPHLVRRFSAGGAELLVNMTNDAWYGRTSAPYQHLAMSAFRAVENGRYLVRAANTGITAVVDPKGRVVASTALFDRTVLVRDVGFVAEPTFYARHGDVFGWGALGAVVALTARVIAERRRALSSRAVL